MLEAIRRIDAVVQAQCGTTIIGPPAGKPWPKGVTLPAAVTEAFAAIDIVKPKVPVFLPFGRLQLLGQQAALRLWKELAEFEDEDAEEFFDETGDDGKVRAVVYDKRRFPLAYDESSTSYVFVDGIPGPKGADGQAIFNPSEASFEVLASSASKLFETLAAGLEDGSLMLAPVPKDQGEGFQLVGKDGKQAEWRTVAGGG